MKEDQKISVSLSGDLSPEATASILRSVRDTLVSKGVSDAGVNVPVDVLILHDSTHVFLCVSLNDVSQTEGKLYIQDRRQIEQLTKNRAVAISINEYGFRSPYVFSFPRRRLKDYDTGLSVLPRYDGSLDYNKCFVIMPFSESMRSVYDHIVSVFKDLSEPRMKCVRADDSFKPEVLTKHIWDKINESLLILADITDGNPNVYYEVGLAHALSKPVILITQDTQVPFDLKEIRRIHYSLQTQRDVDNFKERLRATISEILLLLRKVQDGTAIYGDRDGHR